MLREAAGTVSPVLWLPVNDRALANRLQRDELRLDDRVAPIQDRLRWSRLICRDETGVRVKGQNHWEWVFQ